MPRFLKVPRSEQQVSSLFTVQKSKEEAFEVTTNRSEGEVVDSEIFIRKTFETDVSLGCKLLFQHYYKALCNHAMRIVYSREVCEDIVSEVFCTFLDHKAYEQINKSYRAYLVTATKNRCLNHLRRTHHKSLPIESAQYEETSDSNLPERLMLYADLSQRIEELVSGLPPQCRKIFIMNRFEEKMAKEIAHDLKLSTRTVEVQIAKALSILKNGLKHYLFELLIFFQLAYITGHHTISI